MGWAMELTLGAARHQREEDVVELLHPLGVLGLVRLELETLQQPSPAVKSERKLLLFSFFFLFFYHSWKNCNQEPWQ